MYSNYKSVTLAFIIRIKGDSLRVGGISQEVHLFTCPVSLCHHGTRVSLELADSDRVYWSLDPAGGTRLSQDQADAIGLPRLKVQFFPMANFWHEYHYNAVLTSSLGGWSYRSPRWRLKYHGISVTLKTCRNIYDMTSFDTRGIRITQPLGVTRKTWNNTEKISMAPAQG
ncbi:hypothetical protein B0H16DRAFT_1463346 [Mycena metata]|uniref:Uncharacterized protein n=1 Tax=Mycena metata TaxID=1033252 RepID=A0AAD7ILB7_9AGAR|nr:hypothetical protein B0H16DRAFT_1463346 [Mycena metata]